MSAGTKNKAAKKAAALLSLILTAALSACGDVTPSHPSGFLPGAVSAMAPEKPAAAGTAALNPDAEVRGVWIATVNNINYPSTPGLSEKELKAELDDIVSTAKAAGLNAIYFQVRPTCDALYKSDIFPASEYLSGKQGKVADGDFDSLEYLIGAARLNRIAVHAWVNPLRVTYGTQAYPNTSPDALADANPESPEKPANPAKQHPEWVVEYGGALYLNAGIPEVTELIAAGVAEIVERYDVDGVVFDDYFYPYPVTTKTASGASYTIEFEDSAAYAAYGLGADKGDWRRGNVNRMAEACYKAVKARDEGCLFGIAPFGIWRNDNGANGGSATGGLQSYSEIYCDTLAWVKGGYVDYIAPQIYWSFSTAVARYDTLVKWWNAQLDGTDVKLLVCHGAYRYGSFETDPGREIQNQVEYARSELHYAGSIMYGYQDIKENTRGLADELVALYSENIIYTNAVSNGAPLTFSSPAPGAALSYENTYVLGYSDPTKTLVLNGYPISRTKSGYFSLYLPLSAGTNDFEFVYGGEAVKYTLYRKAAASGGGYTELSSFAITSVSPSADYIGQEGTALRVSCTAPAGSSVTASLNGVTVALNPTIYPKGTAKYYAEVYTGTLTLPAGKKGQASAAGKIKFSAAKGSETASAYSGEIKALGENTGILLEIKKDRAVLLNDPAGDYYTSAYTPQREGASDWAVSLKDNYYLLQMGAWVSKDDVEVKKTGEISAFSGVNSALLWQTGGETSIYLKCADKAPVTATLQADKLIFTIHSVFLKSGEVTYDGSSPVVKSVTLREDKENGRVYAELSLANAENYYGYTVSYVREQGVDCIVFKIKNPKNTDLSSKKPLEGVTIMLDAGHGGTDDGALGFLTGKNGEPEQNEADLNLEITLLVKEKLEALGAAVVLTRSEDVTVSLQDRLSMYYGAMPDLALSIHQNSMLYNADITKIRGTLGLWWSESGKIPASLVSSSVSKALGRYQFSTRAQELYMCRANDFPSALIEVGFMTSAEEYETMVNGNGKEKAARGITEGILEYFAFQNK